MDVTETTFRAQPSYKYAPIFAITISGKLITNISTDLITFDDGSIEQGPGALTSGGGGTPPPPANVAVTGVTLAPTTLNLTVGGSTGILIAKVAPDNAANKTLTWISSDTAVATVNNGTVTAVAEGTATITVTTQDGNKTATCTVNVSAAGSTKKVTFSDVTANGSSTTTTTQLTLTFSEAISGLIASNITFDGVSGASGITKVLSGSGPTYTLAISNVTASGTLSVIVSSPEGFDVNGSPKTVPIYSITPVTFSGVTANGSSTQTTTQIELTFDKAINGLSASNITLSGVSGVTKGALSGSGPTYTLPIGGFTAGGTLNVAVSSPPDYNVSGSPKDVAIYYATNVTLNSVTADGGASQTTTTLTLTLSQAVSGLTADDITLTGVTVSKGSLSGSGPTYTLPISGLTAGGTLNVAVAKTGFNISGSPKTVQIYYATAVTLNNVTANGGTSQTTTQLTLTFDKAITGLASDDITISGVSNVSKGTLSASGATYTLPISGFTSGGTLTVAVAKSGYSVSGSPKTVAINYAPNVTFSELTANGNASQTTTQLTLKFSQAITGLTANDISLDGVTGVSKGTLSASGTTYTLPISGFTSGGTLNVSIAKTGFNISGSPKDVTIYYATAVTLNSVTADGGASQTTTTLTLTFDKAITGLAASDITLSGVTGVSKGTLSASGTTYTLGISGFTSGGTLSVAIAKSGYSVSGSPKSVSIYYATNVTLNSVSANGSSNQTTTTLTLTFDKAITGLAAGDITLSGVTGVSKGTLSASGTTYTLGISGFTSGGTLSVAIAKSGFNISGSSKTVTIHYAAAVTLGSVSANGSSTETTTALTLTFNQAISGLTADNITLSGVTEVSKGTLSGSGPTYTLPISGFASGGNLSVAVASPAGYNVSGGSKTVTIYYYTPPTAVTFSGISADGSSTQTTTQLTLTFSQAITGLAAGDITLSGVSGVNKGTLSGSGPTYTLPISGFTSSGTLNVTVTKSGYNVSGSPKPVPITYVTPTGSAEVTLTFAQISDIPDITGPTISRTGSGYPTSVIITLASSTPAYTNIKWYITGTTTGTTPTQTGGPTFTLNAVGTVYNSDGKHFLTVELMRDGKPYNKTIVFTVVP